MIETTARAYTGLADFFVVYVREQHPNGNPTRRVIRPNEVSVAAPETLTERREIAKEFATAFKLTLPVLVDSLDDTVDRAYQGSPDRIYVIDADGKVAYAGGRGPMGFMVADVPQVLDELLGVSIGSSLALPREDPIAHWRLRFGDPSESMSPH